MKLSKTTIACLLATGFSVSGIASADDAFEFHGYARAGTAYEQDGDRTISVDGSTGNSVGRLGNEGNGGEFSFIKNFSGDNSTDWDVGMMLENWGTLGVKQTWAGASNVFESQPNAYVWAGKVFHSRLQQSLNDYYISMQDGQGAGIKNLELGFANLELGFVDDSDGLHNYAVTSKLSNIKVGDNVTFDIIANYGFADNTVTDPIDAYLLATQIKVGGQNFYARYSDNTENNLFWGKTEGNSSVYFSYDGSVSLSAQTGLEYLLSYQDFKVAEVDDRVAYNAIIRPTFQWDNIHSTWLEVGYSMVDFDDSRTDNSAYKVTLSQNISVGNGTGARPQIRFYVTAGEEKNSGIATNPVIAGAMFEAWW
jgi:maltoporin